MMSSCGSNGFSVWNFFTMCRRRRSSDAGSETSLVRNGAPSSITASKATLASQETLSEHQPNGVQCYDVHARNVFNSGSNPCQGSYDKTVSNNIQRQHHDCADSEVNTGSEVYRNGWSQKPCFVKVSQSGQNGLPCCLRVNQSTNGRPQYEIHKSIPGEQETHVGDTNSLKRRVNNSVRVVNNDSVSVQSNVAPSNTSLISDMLMVFPTSNGSSSTSNSTHIGSEKKPLRSNDHDDLNQLLSSSVVNVPSALSNCGPTTNSGLLPTEFANSFESYTLPGRSQNGIVPSGKIISGLKSVGLQETHYKTSLGGKETTGSLQAQLNSDNQQQLFSLVNGVCHLSQTTQNKDGRYFLELVEMERKRLDMFCSNAEIHLQEHLNKDAEGKIRAAIGKARLLTSKKFCQFGGLCQKNLSQEIDSPFAITNDDLAGFWDMVLIQVNDVHRLFDEIDTLRKHHWQTQPSFDHDICSSASHTNAKNDLLYNQPSAMSAKQVTSTKNSASLPTKPASSSTKPASSSKPASSTFSTTVPAFGSKSGSPEKKSGSTPASRRREEARQRLLAAKLAGRQRKTSESEGNVKIFVS